MADNTDEEHLDNPTINQSENPPDAITPTPDTEDIKPNQETENMEVHHHVHDPAAPHHKKNWKSYFWEFLMLFLAVFCGFLAENQREHMVEHNREKLYMQSVYSDLKKDSAFYNNFANYLTLNYKRLDSVKNAINSRQYISDPKTFYKLVFFSRSLRYFESHTSGYEQLKSSGNLRLIRKKELTDSLVDYYNQVQERVGNQESRYMQATANIAAAMWDILDSKYYTNDALTDWKINRNLSNVSISENAILGNANEEKILKYKNLCYEKMIIVSFLRDFMRTLNEKATSLLLLIKDEYHFK
jgi:hypothetical protein